MSNRTTAALIRNAVEAFKSTGLPVGGIRVSKGGVVEVLVVGEDKPLSSPESGGKSCDEVFGVRSS